MPGLVASERPMTIFCWLPPDRLPVSWSWPVTLVRKFFTYFSVMSYSALRLSSTLPSAPPKRLALVVLAATSQILNRPLRCRSSGT